ncbi:putative GST-like protein YibF [Sinobacterium norvegicum]|uniref:GST-like protein YibF n=1 Tax=Sinobacterium norvegicum TaxID=1641715 RepID=A0ABN8EII7_9GAMM|nr:glutathione S-transferase family protein [Sinobacterium norvegicum]CAH0990667.1 putative GST-like protein YibF [Sinobacterium norvegicum]
MITLYGASLSPYVRKTLVALAIKNLPFEQIQQMPFAKDAEYQKISPLGKIPALKDGDFTISDSAVICQYLDDSYPELALYPSDPQDKARARWYEELGDSQIGEYASGIFFQRFMRPFAFKQDPDEELVEKLINKKLPPILDYLETEVPAQGFMFGEQLMIADIALCSSFFNAGYAGYEVDSTLWPGVSAFIARVKSHPAVAPLLAAEAKTLGL